MGTGRGVGKVGESKGPPQPVYIHPLVMKDISFT